mgnify:CR=1 FL=1
MSYKQERVIVIVSEFVNDKREYYPITDVPVEKARFFYKDDDGLFKVMSSSDYAVRTETNETRLYITSEKIKSESSKFQMGYEINFSASEYETSLPVLSVLVEMYNTLVEDSKTIFNYVKKQCFISDDKTTGLILPNLPPHSVWCMGENNKMYALPVSELYGKFQQMINSLYETIKKLLDKDYTNFSETVKQDLAKHLTDLKNKTDEYIGALKTETNNQKIELDNYTLSKIEEIKNACDRIIGLALNKLTTANTIEQLKTMNFLKVGDIVEVLGYYSAGDGAGHKRIIKAEDDGSGVQLSNNLWACIVHNGEVNVSWFGAKGNDTDDDTEAIQKAVNIGNKINFENRVYLISNTITINKSVVFNEQFSTFKLCGNSGLDINSSDVNINNIKFISGSPEHSWRAISAYKKELENIKIYNCEFIGVNRCIVLAIKKNVLIEKCNMSNSKEKACSVLGDIENITIKNNNIVNSGYTGIEIAGGLAKNVIIDSCYINRNGINGDDVVKKQGINIHGAHNITVVNCTISENKGNGLDISGHNVLTPNESRGKDVIVSNNKFINNDYLNDYSTSNSSSNLIIYASKNVLVSSNMFMGAGSGVQLSTDTSMPLENVDIMNNTFEELSCTASSYRALILFKNIKNGINNIRITNNNFNSKKDVVISGSYFIFSTEEEAKRINNIIIKNNNIELQNDRAELSPNILAFNYGDKFNQYPFIVDTSKIKIYETSVSDYRIFENTFIKMLKANIYFKEVTNLTSFIIKDSKGNIIKELSGQQSIGFKELPVKMDLEGKPYFTIDFVSDKPILLECEYTRYC